MNYIIVIHKPNFFEVMGSLSEKLSNRVSIRKWGDELNSELYISPLSSSDRCIRIHSPEILVMEDYYDSDEIKDVTSLIKEPDKFMTSNMEYSDYGVLRDALQVICENVECYVDNDFGTILSACDFMDKWNSDPEWNWLYDLDD
jgi:hypothetical protein